MRKILFSSFFCGLFFLSGCKSIELEHTYTKFTDVNGNTYVCEYYQNVKINCHKEIKENEKVEKITAFLW